MTEVQSHGFSWEKEILSNIYGLTEAECKTIRYNSKFDLPATLNRIDNCDISIKTTCSLNSVCMGDCLRVFDAVSSGRPLHVTVVYYVQDDVRNVKILKSIVEVDITSSRELLFGTVTRSEIEDLDRQVKTVPRKRKPTEDEYDTMYAMRDALHTKTSAIHLDIKCNSTQSRLQCSFNHFQAFLNENPTRILMRSDTPEFRGRSIAPEISSGRRRFHKRR
jgi:hypothetical protein